MCVLQKLTVHTCFMYISFKFNISRASVPLKHGNGGLHIPLKPAQVGHHLQVKMTFFENSPVTGTEPDDVQSGLQWVFVLIIV